MQHSALELRLGRELRRPLAAIRAGAPFAFKLTTLAKVSVNYGQAKQSIKG